MAEDARIAVGDLEVVVQPRYGRKERLSVSLDRAELSVSPSKDTEHQMVADVTLRVRATELPEPDREEAAE